MLRCLAFIALASFGVAALTLPSAAQNSVSVAKQPAPQRLAPALDLDIPPVQAQSSAPAPQAEPSTPEPAPATPSPAAAHVAPVEVPIERYTTLRPAAPTRPEDEAAAPAPHGGFGSVEQLMDWISNYRKNKAPSRVPAAVHAMRQYGLFGDEEKAWFCTGFIAGVLGSNPKDGPGMIPRMFPMPDKEQAVIIRAIAYSGRPDWRELLESNASRMPLRRPLIDDFLAGKRPILMELPLEHGGSPGIYALWGYYVATGQHAPVVRIMEALRWSKNKSDSGFSFRKIFTGWGSDPSALDKVTAGGTAKWTLASYAERDRELINLYRAEYERQPKEVAKPLKDVIEAAEIFESEKIRKDQFGAIEDAQRAKMSSEAGMTKGATAGSIAIATGCVAASALGQAYIALPCVLGGALYTGAVKLAR
ncbi:MAG TPA: hypothetical protein VLB11_10695 [Methyloceanibacter sp.]|nr:hypothetical protein [Methyloceanibacter sp.]